MLITRKNHLKRIIKSYKNLNQSLQELISLLRIEDESLAQEAGMIQEAFKNRAAALEKLINEHN